VKRRRVDAEEKQAVSNQADFHSDFDANNTKRPSSSAQLDTTVTAVDRSESCKPDVDKPKEKAPVDRIERMRLKKQQQKARNKEKKAASAAAAASKSTSLKNEK
jgi:hypothetical protein